MKVTKKRLEHIKVKLAMAVEPKCPAECGASVGRPKCMWELPPDQCPRHSIAQEWRIHARALESTAFTDITDLIETLEYERGKAKTKSA